MINQPIEPKEEKYYNTSATQTILIEDNDQIIDDDMEIIPNIPLHDDFVQLDFNECNEQQSKV